MLLLVGSVLADHVGHDEVGVDHPGDAHPAAGQFLDTQRVCQKRLTQSAVLLRNHQTEQAHLAHLIDDVLWVGVGVLELLGVGNDLFIDELPYRGDDLSLELGQAQGLGEPGHMCRPPVTSSTVPVM